MTASNVRSAVLAASLAALSFFVAAQTLPRPERPFWNELTPGQQTVLAPIEKTWDDNDSARKRKWVELAARYPKMSEQEQANAQQRIAEWAKLSSAERRATRQNFQAAQQVNPEKRAARWEAYQALPDEEKRRLAEQRAAKVVTPKATTAPAPIPRPQAAKPGEPGHHAQLGRREPAKLAGADSAKAVEAAAPTATLAPKAP